MFKGLFKRVTDKVQQLVQGRGKIDEELYEELEETLIESDVGVQTATRLVQGLREATRKQRLSTAEEVTDWLKAEIGRLLASDEAGLRWAAQPPTLVLVVG